MYPPRTRTVLFLRIILIPVLALTALAGSARAFTLTLSNALSSPPGPNLIVSQATGQPIGLGMGTVSGGFFTISDAAIMSAASVAELVAGYVQFANAGNINGGGFGIPGVYTVDAIADIPIVPSNPNFSGQTVYTFIGNGPSLLMSDEVLIVKFPGLTFAPNPSPGGTAFLTQESLGAGSAVILQGAFPGPLGNVGFGDLPGFVTTLVPEASTAFLVAFSSGLLLLRRRRV